MAERAAMLAAQSLADEWYCHKVIKYAVALVTLALAGEQCHHEVAERNTMLVARALADERSRHEVDKRAATLAELALAGERRNCQQQRQQWWWRQRRQEWRLLALIIPYKNEWNDSAQKGQTPPLGKMCCRKQTS
jgi:hypothetical protein